MRLTFRRFDLALRHPWAISTDLGQGGGRSAYPVVFVELTDAQAARALEQLPVALRAYSSQGR